VQHKRKKKNEVQWEKECHFAKEEVISSISGPMRSRVLVLGQLIFEKPNSHPFLFENGGYRNLCIPEIHRHPLFSFHRRWLLFSGQYHLGHL
jgi:hypothetical protein